MIFQGGYRYWNHIEMSELVFYRDEPEHIAPANVAAMDPYAVAASYEKEGYIISTSDQDYNYQIYNAFSWDTNVEDIDRDNITTDGSTPYHSQNNPTESDPIYINITFPAGKHVVSYSIVSRMDNANYSIYAPTQWDLECSFDNFEWIVVDTRKNIKWTANGLAGSKPTMKTFEPSWKNTNKGTVIRYWRFKITGTTHNLKLAIGQLLLFSTTPCNGVVWNRKADHLIGENTRMRIETGNQLYACEFDYKKYIEKRKQYDDNSPANKNYVLATKITYNGLHYAMGNIWIQHIDTNGKYPRIQLTCPGKLHVLRYDTHESNPNGYYFKVPMEEVSYILGFIPPHTEVYNCTVLRKDWSSHNYRVVYEGQIKLFTNTDAVLGDSYVRGRRETGHGNHQWYDGDIITNLMGQTADGAAGARIYVDDNVTSERIDFIQNNSGVKVSIGSQIIRDWKLHYTGTDSSGSASSMFRDCNRFDGDVSGWSFTNPTNLGAMFYDCSRFRGNGLSSWCIQSPLKYKYYMNDMFYNCNQLGTGVDIDLSQGTMPIISKHNCSLEWSISADNKYFTGTFDGLTDYQSKKSIIKFSFDSDFYFAFSFSGGSANMKIFMTHSEIENGYSYPDGDSKLPDSGSNIFDNINNRVIDFNTTINSESTYIQEFWHKDGEVGGKSRGSGGNEVLMTRNADSPLHSGSILCKSSVRYLQLRALGSRQMRLREIQLWVNNVNVAAVGNASALPAVFRNYENPGYTSHYIWTANSDNVANGWPAGFTREYSPDYANNNSLLGPVDYNGNGNTGDSVRIDTNVPADKPNDPGNTYSLWIDLGTNYSGSDLQAIVIYNQGGDSNIIQDWLRGYSVQLLDENEQIVYDSPPMPTNRAYYYRINLPAWPKPFNRDYTWSNHTNEDHRNRWGSRRIGNQVSSEMMTEDESEFATKIIDRQNHNNSINGTRVVDSSSKGNYDIIFYDVPENFQFTFAKCCEPTSVGIGTSPENYHYSWNLAQGSIDYTYCYGIKHLFNDCNYLGQNASFKMDNCNFRNIDHNSYSIFYYTFGYYSYRSVDMNWKYTWSGKYYRDKCYFGRGQSQSLKNWIIGKADSSGTRSNWFREANRFNGDVSNWVITNPTNLGSMFYNADDFAGKGLSSWTLSVPQAGIDGPSGDTQGGSISMGSFLYGIYYLGRGQGIDMSYYPDEQSKPIIGAGGMIGKETASGSFGEGYATASGGTAKKAFNDTLATSNQDWITSAPGWLQIECPKRERALMYRMWAVPNADSTTSLDRFDKLPRNWEIQASNNNSDWTTIDKRPYFKTAKNLPRHFGKFTDWGAPHAPTYVAWDEANKLYVCLHIYQSGADYYMYAVRLDFQGNQVGGGRYRLPFPSQHTHPSGYPLGEPQNQAEIVSLWGWGIDGQGHHIQFSAGKHHAWPTKKGEKIQTSSSFSPNDDISHGRNYSQWTIMNPGEYQYYRIYVHSTNSTSSNNLAIGELAYYSTLNGWDYSAVKWGDQMMDSTPDLASDGGNFKMDNCNFTNAQKFNSMFQNGLGYDFTLAHTIFNWSSIGLYVESVTLPLIHARSRYSTAIRKHGEYFYTDATRWTDVFKDGSSPPVTGSSVTKAVIVVRKGEIVYNGDVYLSWQDDFEGNVTKLQGRKLSGNAVGDWEIGDTIYAKYIQGKSIEFNNNPHDNITQALDYNFMANLDGDDMSVMHGNTYKYMEATILSTYTGTDLKYILGFGDNTSYKSFCLRTQKHYTGHNSLGFRGYSYDYWSNIHIEPNRFYKVAVSYHVADRKISLYALDMKNMINYSDEHIFDTSLDTGTGDLCIGGGLSSGLHVSTNKWQGIVRNVRLYDGYYDRLRYEPGPYTSMKNWNWNNPFTYTNSSEDEIIDSSGITMNSLFYNCKGFDPDVTGWTIKNPKIMSSMFFSCHSFTGVGLSSWSVTCPLGIHYGAHYFFQSNHKLGDGIDIDFSGITDGAYVILYRDGIGFIDIESIKAYDINNTEISHVSWTHLGSNNTYSMDNALIDGHTTDVYGMWSTNNTGSNGYSGGWIKYPEMPHRMVIVPRYNNSRLPDYLKTSFIPPNGTDYTTWTTRYEFNDPSNPSSYNIPLGGGWDYSCCTSVRKMFHYCNRLGRDSIFRMENCQFVVLQGNTNNYSLNNVFSNSFGRDTSNKMEYNTNGIYFKNWNIDYSVSPYSSTENNASSMFQNCPRLMNADFSGWTLKGILNLDNIFYQSYDFMGNGLGTWVVSNCDTNWSNSFNDAYITPENYSKFLIQANTWTNQPATTLSANDAYYGARYPEGENPDGTLAAETARASLISKGWTIIDMGRGPSSANLFFRAGDKTTQGNLFDCRLSEHKPIIYNNIFISKDSIGSRYCVWNDDPSTMGPLTDSGYSSKGQISFENVLKGSNENWTLAFLVDMMSNDTVGESYTHLHNESVNKSINSSGNASKIFYIYENNQGTDTRRMGIDEVTGGGNPHFGTYDPDHGNRNGKMLMVLRHRAHTGKLQYAERWAWNSGWQGIQEVSYNNSSRQQSATWTSLLNRFNMSNNSRRTRLYAMAKWARWLTDDEVYSMREDHFRMGAYR